MKVKEKAMSKDYPPITPITYKSVMPANTIFTFVSAKTIFPYNLVPAIGDRYYRLIIYNNRNIEPIFSNTYVTGTYNHIGEDKGYTTNLEIGTYILQYDFGMCDIIGGKITNYDTESKATYYISVVENKLPLKKWTITEVINRTLDLAEPIRQGEKSRFRLNGMRADGTIITEDNKKDGEKVGQAAKFDKILAPEFCFTKQTLRECLQEIGGVIHGEPRLKPVKDGDGYYYELTYDMYASQEESGIYTRSYLKKTVGQLIEGYASHLDSAAENLVNQMDKYGGVIVEPYERGAKSVRTENNYVRIEAGNMVIATQYPVYSVSKLEYVYADGGEVKSLDITPWLFEKSIYDTQLSSYEKQYPYSKVYGLYYTQGQKNIGGLNFKVPEATTGDQVYGNYSIINILRQAMSNSSYTVDDYADMCFRVTYTPIYNARVTQTKSHYKDFIRPAGLIYNQQSNIIESRYYGENLKGAIARLGNIEKTLTFHLYNIQLIPKAGQMYDKNYYISAVAVEILPTVIKCTIGLSKDFNRLSRYIGISSVKRYSEISQTQAVERNTLYREFIVIGKQEATDNDILTGPVMLAMIAYTFKPDEIFKGPVTNVVAWGTSYKGKNSNAVNLPVISSAFGNSISFSWKYEDNYSAGAISQYKNNDNVKGNFQNGYSYTDYYGRLYYYNFDLQLSGAEPSANNITETAKNLPAGQVPDKSSYIVSTVGKPPIVMRKDNREALQVNFQIDFVTNLENFIIGSALASYCRAVRGVTPDLSPRLYVFPKELNKFTDHIEAYEDVDLSDLPSAEIDTSIESGYFTVTAENFPASGKSWAIVTKQYKKPSEKVEDEKGEVYEQQETVGGDLLIGQNIEVTAGQAFAPVYFTPKREIFDKTVWKDRR